jgi:hypothetical protein
MEQVARELKIQPGTVRRILDRKGIPLYQKPEPDENAVLRCYDRAGQVIAAATMLGISAQRVEEVLDKHDVPHNQAGRIPELSTARTRQQGGEKRRQEREPGAADLLRAGEAAQLAGVTTAMLLIAVAHGLLVNRGSERFPRYRRDEVTALAARRNAPP